MSKKKKGSYVYTEEGAERLRALGRNTVAGDTATFCGEPIDELTPTARQWVENGLIIHADEFVLN